MAKVVKLDDQSPLGTGETGHNDDPFEEPTGGIPYVISVELYHRSRVRLRRFRVRRIEGGEADG